MARPQNRKRRYADDGAEDKHPSKKIKSRGHRSSLNFLPEFWDRLSKVWLTPCALRELDWRNSIWPATKPTTFPVMDSQDLACFARHGSLDIRHLRGTTASHHSSESSGPGGNTKTTNATSISSEARRSSAASLSPSRIPASVFRDFRQKNRTKSEGTAMRNVIPLIAGSADVPNEGHLPFTNLESLTNKTTVKPVPDYFDGARIPRGSADAAQRQACRDGAYGAGAMRGLQNYGDEAPVYDNNAYTLRAYALTSDQKTLIDRSTACRNARELAARHRAGFLEAANLRARRRATTRDQGIEDDSDWLTSFATSVSTDQTSAKRLK
ncbi:hypothetical protein F5X98DRAFT_368684 [Xylaria grammica]|nr:hypothetical protein F5X98DRAFT_368684 [Xylaria grammica]